MATTGFFQERSDQSRVKAELVEKYFFFWANALKKSVVERKGRLAYIDLFAGPGRYEDGAASVPLVILERAIEDDFLRDHLVTLFNDKDDKHTQTLEEQIGATPDIRRLKHEPQVMNEEVGENIVKMFEQMNLVPTLFFVDPWGYKGLSLQLINSVLKDWGCDCIFFFNYNRVNLGLGNPMVNKHMNALFGEERADKLRARLAPLSPAMRELTIVEALSEALNEMGGEYVLPFTFKREDGSRTSHYLIFVSKHPLGYGVMKEIMAKASSNHHEGVPSFSYCPADETTPLLFEFARPLSELGEMLCSEFAGKSIKMSQVYDLHHVGRPFIKKNYKAALNRLESEGQIVANPPASERPKREGQPTFSDKVLVTFPEKK
ncbi:MAG: three-Cys-motif partner protein TcmP [Pseudomonadota bacterium]